MSDERRPPVQPAIDPFPSLTALRAAHASLLEAHRSQADGADFWPQVDAFLWRGQATGALLDQEGERVGAQSLLDYWTATAYSVGRTAPDALLLPFDPTLAPEIPDARCPYVGLAAFREGEGPYFFGRRQLIESLVAKVATDRLLAVVGPSGSGKSSIVLAGLLPALKAGAVPATADSPASREWRYSVRMVPGSDPLAHLARAIQPRQSIDEFDVTVAAKYLFAPEGLLREETYLVNLLAAESDLPLVLVVDQFEELFTLCTDERLRNAFMANLLALLRRPTPRHTVILTMRTDFESYVARLPNFQPLFEQAIVRITPLNAAELREAIERPADMVGLKFEEGVVDGLVQDLLGEPAALPLLQFTLLKLWENRERNRITWEAYRRLGGGRLALARSADQLYDHLIPEEQVTARRILLRLVRPGEGLEVTSNRVRRAVLYQSGEAHDRVDRVLQRLIDADLIRLSPGDKAEDDQVEVAHEALVRNWPRLVGWLEDERLRLRERLRLTEAAEQWLKLGRDPAALLRGALLEEAQRHPDLSELEEAFVTASLAARQRAEQEREAARERELVQARALAQEQAERANAERDWADYQARAAAKLRGRAWSLGFISVVALLLAGMAIWLTIVANRQNVIVSNERAIAEAAREEALHQAATADAASTMAVQQAVTADAASTIAVQQAATADAARSTAQADAMLARTAEAVAVAEQTKVAHVVAALDYTGQQLNDIQATIEGALNVATPVPGTPTPSPSSALPTPTGRGAITPTLSITTAPLAIYPLTVTAALIDPNAIVLTQTMSDAITGVVNTVLAPLPGIEAVVPDIEVPLYAEPRDELAPLLTLRAPMTLPILQASSYWVQVVVSADVAATTATDEPLIGWVQAWLLTYRGDAAMLPAELRYLVLNEAAAATQGTDLPFIYGVVISVDGATGYPLRDAPNPVANAVAWSPVDTPVTLLFTTHGTPPPGYGNAATGTEQPQWYFVSMVDPGGANLIWRGYLPAAVVAAR